MFRGNVPLSALVCDGETTPALLQAKTEITSRGQALLGATLFTCTARDCRSDAAGFSHVFPHSPMIGMPCGGEIGPQAKRRQHEYTHNEVATQVGEVALQGFTAVYGLFSVPRRQERRRAIRYEDVGAAFVQSRTRPAAVALQHATAAALLHHGEEPEESEGEGDSFSEESSEYSYGGEDNDFSEAPSVWGGGDGGDADASLLH